MENEQYCVGRESDKKHEPLVEQCVWKREHWVMVVDAGVEEDCCEDREGFEVKKLSWMMR